MNSTHLTVSQSIPVVGEIAKYVDSNIGCFLIHQWNRTLTILKEVDANLVALHVISDRVHQIHLQIRKTDGRLGNILPHSS